jgi:DNA-directed RNA polymerase specialized sigma24 family protein
MDSLMELSDGVAVAQARAGDSGAFRILVERHSRNLFRLAYRMTGHQEDAEEPLNVVQALLVAAGEQQDLPLLFAPQESRAPFRSLAAPPAKKAHLLGQRNRQRAKWPGLNVVVQRE